MAAACEPVSRHSGEPNAGICVLTSGGDAQGMNACVRAVVRTALARGVPAFVSMDGYAGLYRGTELSIRSVSWSDVSGILHRGGTAISTSRCDEFRTREGRMQAARHLLERGIDSLVVIGGDGSLTGASLFVSEWPELTRELASSGVVPHAVAARHPRLYVAGAVGSIDNDMVGTDFTIGCVSALHRIVEAVDAICTTAASHHRSFVVEVMGRNCGWLALWAAAATGADFAFVPEAPPAGDWRAVMCAKVASQRSDKTKPFSLVIVAEGAVDASGAPIKADAIKAALEHSLAHDTRVTILGHVQRGGRPAAFDRVMATLVGVRAVDELLAVRARAVAGEPAAGEPFYVGASASATYVRPLMESVQLSKDVGRAISERRFGDALALRSPEVAVMLADFTDVEAASAVSAPGPDAPRVGVVHIGAPAPGMNATVRALTGLLRVRGRTLIGIRNGLDGLLLGQTLELGPEHVQQWAMEGGAKLGSSRTTPRDAGVDAVAAALAALALDALVIVGGFEAYTATAQLVAASRQVESDAGRALARLRVCIVPATISANVPCTDFSIGFDSALNAVVLANDACKQSADSTNCRVFVIEVMGARCGALAVLAAIASGAERAYTHESGIQLGEVADDIARFHGRFADAGFGAPSSLIIRSNGASEHFSTQLLHAMYDAEARGCYSVRTSVLGYLQQGGDPSPLDRVRSMQLAAEAVRWLGLARDPARQELDAAVVGIRGSRVALADFVSAAMPEMDSVNRRARTQWWRALEPLVPLLSLKPVAGSSRAAAS